MDSGTTLSLLPQALVEALAAQFPGTTSDGHGGYKVPCSYQQQPGTVSFSLATSFSGAGSTLTINLPYAEFVWNAGNDNCYLGAWYDTSVSVHILDDTPWRLRYLCAAQGRRPRSRPQRRTGRPAAAVLLHRRHPPQVASLAPATPTPTPTPSLLVALGPLESAAPKP